MIKVQFKIPGKNQIVTQQEREIKTKSGIFPGVFRQQTKVIDVKIAKL